MVINGLICAIIVWKSLQLFQKLGFLKVQTNYEIPKFEKIIILKNDAFSESMMDGQKCPF